MLARSLRERLCTALTVALASSCGGAGGGETRSPSAVTTAAAAEAPRGGARADTAPGAAPAEATAGTFVADFSSPVVASPFNVFGAKSGRRRASGGSEGLLLEILTADSDKAWDAVGVRTAQVTVEGDFDLRGAFQGFTSSGNGSAKLLVVDAASGRGEAAYVERIRIDGKDLYKFGGEIDGALENWGFVEASGGARELRLERRGGVLHAYQRMDLNTPWAEFAPAQPVPKTMARVLKFGVKLSAQGGRSAQVTWTRLALDGNLARVP